MKNELLSHAPEVAAIAGFAAGIAVDMVAKQRGDKKQAAVLSTQGANRSDYDAVLDGAELETNTEPQIQRKTTSERFGDTLREPWVPLSMGLAAGLCVAAWSQEDVKKTLGSELAIVADHSFQIGQSNDQKRVASILKQFEDTGKIKVRAFVAQDGTYEAIKPGLIEEERPYGPPSVNSTVGAVLKNVKLTENESANQNILVVTANNLGNTNTVIKRASSEKTHISVVNLGVSEGKQAQAMQAIAKRTGGEYWDGKASVDTIVADVKEAAKPREITERREDEDSLTEKILGGLAALLAVGLIKSRAALRFKRRDNEIIRRETSNV